MKASSKLLQVRLIVVFDGDATVAIAEGCGIKVAASAKREPGDRSDPLIGTDLAVSRALRKMSRRMERRANGAVRQAAHVKAEHAARKAAQKAQFPILQEEELAALGDPALMAAVNEAKAGDRSKLRKR